MCENVRKKERNAFKPVRLYTNKVKSITVFYIFYTLLMLAWCQVTFMGVVKLYFLNFYQKLDLSHAAPAV